MPPDPAVPAGGRRSTTLARIGLGVLALTAVMALPWPGGTAGGQAIIGHYGRVRVDIASLKLSLEDPLPFLPRPARRLFVRFTDVRGRHEVADCEPPEQPPVCYNLFNLDPDYRLVYRIKHQRLLAGEFGTVYGFVTYYYGAQYGDQPNGLETRLYSADLRQEPPREGPSLDPLPAAASLSAVSVVRVLRAAPGALVASANYARDGHLYALHVNGSRQGVWVHSNEVQRLHPGAFGVATMIGDRPKTRTTFGLPETFPVSAYVQGGVKVFGAAVFPSVLDAVLLHYDRSRVVRRDLHDPSGRVSTTFLRFEGTPEDQVLDTVDRRRGFADVPYTRDERFKRDFRDR